MNDNSSVKAYKYTALAMGLLEKILGSQIEVEGIENIPQKPVLFVSNHFTRSETFVVPYIIHKYTKRQVRCLADRGLFSGFLGRFLKSVGAVSTRDPKRDLIIIADLMKGDYDWMIYPEGSMVKSKEIRSEGKVASYLFKTPYDESGESRVRTGAAVLGLKSELYREDLIDAHNKGRDDVLRYYEKEIGVTFDPKIKDVHTSVVPVNITYYPIRPGENVIQRLIGRIFKAIPSQISEELEIEGNLLLSSNINISFGKPIHLSSYIRNSRSLISPLPIISSETKANLILKYLKYRLTNQFMEAIYLGTQINLDHLVAAILHFYPQNKISKRHLKSLVYLSANQIIGLKKYRTHPDLVEGKLYQLLSAEYFDEFESVIDLAEMTGIISKSNEVQDFKHYFIDKAKLEEKHDFQKIRLVSTLQVILNEFLLLSTASDVVRRNAGFTEEVARKKAFDYVVAKDLRAYEEDYKKYYDPNLSKAKEIGMPLYLDDVTKTKDGILLVHGYLSSPKELEEMARYFNNLGYKTYSVRLAGHATAPINLEDVTWHDWYLSLNRGYSALRMVCSNVFIVGFSTGALLTLVAAFKKSHVIEKIICINPAIRLKDFRARFAAGVDLWNEMLSKIHIEKLQMRYVENPTESPESNYSQNYIKGIEQLSLLIEECELILTRISCKVLIIQSDDPVVDSKGSAEILKKINSKDLIFKQVESNKHSIIKGKEGVETCEIIKEFIES